MKRTLKVSRRATDWGTERRASHRYPVELVLKYQTLQSGGRGESRIGMTLDFSSHGVLISAAQSQIPTPGSKLHVAVEWPVALDGKTPLQLVVRGKVVRVGPATFALLFERYEFHIRKPRQALP